VISQIASVTVPGFAIGAVLMALGNRHVDAATAGARWTKLAVFFVIVHVVLGVCWLGRPFVTMLMLLILAAGGLEFWRAWQRMRRPRPSWAWTVFAVAAGLALACSWLLPPDAFAFLFIVTAACDGFSQVVGQLIGRRLLAPELSPGKTVEGLLGGLTAAVVVALLLRRPTIDAAAWTAALAVLVGVAGLGGDLAASWAKRRAGLKDFSSVLPGQGGVLDRFDSLLGALAIAGPLLTIAGFA